jgi:hypothetical protein
MFHPLSLASRVDELFHEDRLHKKLLTSIKIVFRPGPLVVSMQSHYNDDRNNFPVVLRPFFAIFGQHGNLLGSRDELEGSKVGIESRKGEIQREVENQFEEISMRLILMPIVEINRRRRQYFLHRYWGFCRLITVFV